MPEVASITIGRSRVGFHPRGGLAVVANEKARAEAGPAIDQAALERVDHAARFVGALAAHAIPDEELATQPSRPAQAAAATSSGTS